MERVLVIDDEPRIVTLIARALAARGFAVDGASDPRRGLELACTGGYSLVVLDLRMPAMDGVTVLRRTMEAVPEQQVLVLSAAGDVESKVRCLELGAADYLTKPFALAELVARVRTRLRRRESAAEPEPVLSAGTLRLDLRRRTAELGGRAVALSAREFVLLSHLVRRAGQVCTREELLADVWGYTFDPGTNVVDVYVRRIRAKLGAGLVETVRNVGYALVAP